jgi:hypothetical protein
MNEVRQAHPEPVAYFCEWFEADGSNSWDEFRHADDMPDEWEDTPNKVTPLYAAPPVPADAALDDASPAVLKAMVRFWMKRADCEWCEANKKLADVALRAIETQQKIERFNVDLAGSQECAAAAREADSRSLLGEARDELYGLQLKCYADLIARIDAVLNAPSGVPQDSAPPKPSGEFGRSAADTSSSAASKSGPLTEPWRTLHKRLIVLGAAILRERHWGFPIKLAEAEKQDEALAQLAWDARRIADALAAAAPRGIARTTAESSEQRLKDSAEALRQDALDRLVAENERLGLYEDESRRVQTQGERKP